MGQSTDAPTAPPADEPTAAPEQEVNVEQVGDGDVIVNPDSATTDPADDPPADDGNSDQSDPPPSGE